MKLLFYSKKAWGGCNLNDPQGNISINRIEVCSLNLTLNLLLSHVVFTSRDCT